ncbi:MAG: tetratricopeptide repeat protein [Treponema sp.]|jgi:tetratricopeptide (TPR) repeat protein|nr:tetratricopeptide repeat protein [Treponema sp.]
MGRLFAAMLACAALAAVPVRAEDSGLGDAAAAERYAAWALDAMNRGAWPEALAVLERAGDYSGASSDVSFLLALAREHEQKPRGAVLEALGRALEADRWNRSPFEARLLEAETFIYLRNYTEALRILDRIPEGEKKAELRLLALKGLNDISAFRRAMEESLDRYPRDPRIARILLEYAAGGLPEQSLLKQGEEIPVPLVLRRLPVLLEGDPELAFLAAPFLRNEGEVRRLVAAYRAGFAPPAGPSPASLPAALNAGLIEDTEAVAELFAGTFLDRDLLLSVFGLLRSGGGRDFFNRNLLAFSGVIMEDGDKDGYYESRTRYRNGEIQDYVYDADQDRLPELTVVFSGQEPDRAEQTVLPESAVTFSLPVRDEDRIKALVVWEQYPAVLAADLEGCSYIPRPFEFFFNPVRFVELCGNGDRRGLLYPEMEKEYPRISRRSLVSFSIQIRRPSGEFRGADERIDLDRGIPRRASEIHGGRVVSVTEFEQGRPVIQRIDLDLDGRMETVRRFRSLPLPGRDEDLLDWKNEIVFTESDWNGDGRYETAEEALPGGVKRYYKDMDGDGIRDYSDNVTDG